MIVSVNVNVQVHQDNDGSTVDSSCYLPVIGNREEITSLVARKTVYIHPSISRYNNMTHT